MSLLLGFELLLLCIAVLIVEGIKLFAYFDFEFEYIIFILSFKGKLVLAFVNVTLE